MVTENLMVLELNANFVPLSLCPLSVVSWQSAFKKIVEEVAYPIHYYDNEYIHSPGKTWKVPSVIVMKDFKHLNLKAKWSKFNVKLRDKFHCQYCGKRFSAKSLTIDHIIPRSIGGRFTWENSATACKPCNNNKKNNIIKPVRKAYRPTYFELAKNLADYKAIVNEDWYQYTKFLKGKQIGETV